MTFEQNVKDIKRVYFVLTGKENPEVHISYRGHSGGIANPWSIRIDTREVHHANHEEGAQQLLIQLKQELIGKITNAEAEANAFRKALETFN
jgi:hypothetical protein